MGGMGSSSLLGVVKNASVGGLKHRDVFIYSNALVLTSIDRSWLWVTALSRQFGLLGALLFTPWLNRIDQRRIAGAPETPEALATARQGTLIPVPTIVNAELTKGLLSSTIRLSTLKGESHKFTWTRGDNNYDQVRGWLHEALGARLLDSGAAAA